MTDFEKLVKAMRDAQKEYFKTRDFNVLHKSKDLEKEVDTRLKELESGEQDLFHD